MTFYLKYRPQTVAELDLDGVRSTLQKIVSNKNIPHAFLFSGPRGAGKTSTARILAKAINCEKPEKNGEPCNKCEQCLSITRGSSLDVLEIDAASHRGVDDIRSLRETVKLAASGSNKKVYIIDEAHMLTTEAANALLKTLEEPPSHVVFILATTEPQKLLDTIRSRCTTISFYKGEKQEILRSLQKVVDGEKIKIEKTALDEIAKRVDGSFREAHKVLEQLALTNQEITEETVRNLISGIGKSPQKLLSLLGEKDTKGAFLEIEEAVNLGVNLKNYTAEAISILRKLLLFKAGVSNEAEEVQGLKTVGEIEKLIELLNEAYQQFGSAVIPQLPLELVVVKWGMREESVSSHLARNSAIAKGDTGSRDVRTSQASDSHPLEPASDKRTQHSMTHDSYKEEGEDEVKDMKSEESPQVLSDTEKAGEDIGLQAVEAVDGDTINIATAFGDAELEARWRDIMKLTKIKNHSLEALLRACKPAAFDGRSLTVEVFYKFHKDRLETASYRTMIEDVASEVLKCKPVRLVCVLSQTKQKAADIVNITVPDEEDVVKIAEEIFGATSDGKVH